MRNDVTEHIGVRCQTLRRTGTGYEPVDVAGCDDELFLLVHLTARQPTTCSMVVELCRGDVLRDRREEVVAVAPHVSPRLLYRMTWSRRTDCSARLAFRVLIDGRLTAQGALLVGNVEIDGQGRISGIPGRSPSVATQLAYAEVLRRQCSDLEKNANTAPGFRL